MTAVIGRTTNRRTASDGPASTPRRPSHIPPTGQPSGDPAATIPRRARLLRAAHEAWPTEEAGCMSDTQEQTGAGGDGPAITVHKIGMLESVDISERADVHKLRKGAVGIWGCCSSP